MNYIGKRHGFKCNQKVYVPASAKYGFIRQYRGKLFKVEYIRGGEIWVHPHEIEDGS